MNCDLCGIKNDKLRNITSNKADNDLLLEFQRIIRKKKTKNKMLLNIMCENCFAKMSYLVETFNELWNLYNLNKNIDKDMMDCKGTDEYSLYIVMDDSEMMCEDIELGNIKDLRLRYQLESSVMAEGCTQLEWLQDSEILTNDSFNTELSPGDTSHPHVDCLYDKPIVGHSKEPQNCKQIEDALNYKENKVEVISRKNEKPTYSIALTEFSREFIVKGEDGNRLICTLCNKVLRCSKDKVHHIRKVHLHERPFSCQICSKTFTTKRYLNHHHKFVHSGQSFLCQKCGLEFPSVFLFKTHENEHLGDPKYVCPHNNCSKKFYGHSALRNHIKGCHSAAKHVCEKCGKVFSTAERVKIHSRRHLQRTVKCSLCPQMFYTKSDLGPHMKHHKAWAWKCSKCNMSFKSTRGLQQHSSATHGEKLTRHQLYKKNSSG